ncbi:MAG: exodeoxyribonuclease VII large subunit [Thermoplasmata archaeon]
MIKNSPEKELDIHSVSSLNKYVESVLKSEPTLRNIWVKGEISNFTHYHNRHMYFSLKDKDSELSCVMFYNANKEMDFKPTEGQEVICKGDVGFYHPKGKYQFVIQEMVPDGIGKLYQAYEKLKKKLDREGFFSPEYKKPLPFLPKRVGIVTSSDGAALRDILNILHRRYPNVSVLISSTSVQGKGSPESIAKAIKLIDRQDIDVMVVGRGGGSIEDLWSFNEEVVARAIFQAKTPVVSAVGHETDVLISDFVADKRAPTPSAAAELVVPDKNRLKNKMKDEKKRILSSLKNVVAEGKNRLKRITECLVFTHPERFLEEHEQRLDDSLSRLQENVERKLEALENDLKLQSEKLKAMGPVLTMKRGYSVVLDSNDKVTNSIRRIKTGDILNIKMKDGSVSAEVKEVKKWKMKK